MSDKPQQRKASVIGTFGFKFNLCDDGTIDIKAMKSEAPKHLADAINAYVVSSMAFAGYVGGIDRAIGLMGELAENFRKQQRVAANLVAQERSKLVLPEMSDDRPADVSDAQRMQGMFTNRQCDEPRDSDASTSPAEAP